MSEKKPRVLVIDDTEAQRDCALQTIDQDKYDLTIVDGIEAAAKELGIAKCFEDGKIMYFKAEDLRDGYSPPFDYVLTDLMMPPSRYCLGEKGYDNCRDTLFPYGFPLMILLLQTNVKGIAILSGQNHHNDPMNAFCDAMRFYHCTIGDKRVMVVGDSRPLFEGPEIGTNELGFPNPGKHWGKALDTLITGVWPEREY